MADEMPDDNDPLLQFVLEESRVLAAQEAAQRCANVVPRSLTVRQAWEARQAACPSIVLEEHAGRPAMERFSNITVRGPPSAAAGIACPAFAAATNIADVRNADASASEEQVPLVSCAGYHGN